METDIYDLQTNKYFNWKDHLKYHGLLILIGGIIFSFVLVLGANSNNGEAIARFFFYFLMCNMFVIVLMIPYSVLMLLLHHFFPIRFGITVFSPFVFSIVLTIVTLPNMGIAIFEGFVYGITGF